MIDYDWLILSNFAYYVSNYLVVNCNITLGRVPAFVGIRDEERGTRVKGWGNRDQVKGTRT